MAKPLQVIAEKHYENFPVGSFFLPKDLREPIRLIYAFARAADDIADEGNDSRETRSQRLDDWEGEFRRGVATGKGTVFFRQLAEVVIKYSIPQSLFIDLITAFRMDAGGKAIQVRSASRVGKGDLGVNRKRVERLRDLLKTKGLGA